MNKDRLKKFADDIDGFDSKSDEYKEGFLDGFDRCSDGFLRLADELFKRRKTKLDYAFTAGQIAAEKLTPEERAKLKELQDEIDHILGKSLLLGDLNEYKGWIYDTAKGV